MPYSFSADDRLSLVPTSRLTTGPQVCLAVMPDAQRGILTAEWFSLMRPLGDLTHGVQRLQGRGVTSTTGPIGVFDFEGVDVAVLRTHPSLTELRGAGRAGSGERY